MNMCQPAARLRPWQTGFVGACALLPVLVLARGRSGVSCAIRHGCSPRAHNPLVPGSGQVGPASTRAVDGEIAAPLALIFGLIRGRMQMFFSKIPWRNTRCGFDFEYLGNSERQGGTCPVSGESIM